MPATVTQVTRTSSIQVEYGPDGWWDMQLVMHSDATWDSNVEGAAHTRASVMERADAQDPHARAQHGEVGSVVTVATAYHQEVIPRQTAESEAIARLLATQGEDVGPRANVRSSDTGSAGTVATRAREEYEREQRLRVYHQNLQQLLHSARNGAPVASPSIVMEDATAPRSFVMPYPSDDDEDSDYEGYCCLICKQTIEGGMSLSRDMQLWS